MSIVETHMIIPIRCFTCGKVLANKWLYYQERVKVLEAKSEDGEKDDKEYKNFEPIYKKKILDELQLTKMCCRRHMLTHVDMIDVI